MTTASPIEDFLDIEPGSTEQDVKPPTPVTSAIIDPTSGEVVERKTSELTQDAIDREERIEDIQVDAQLSEIHNAAMQAFYQQAALAQQVEPKFSARNAEVAAQFLTAALNTVNSRVDAKFKRQKVRLEKAKLSNGTPNQVQNNLIITDRNSLMKSLLSDMQGVVDMAEGKSAS